MNNRLKKIMVGLVAIMVMSVMCACNKEGYDTAALKDVDVLASDSDHSQVGVAQGNEGRYEVTGEISLVGEGDTDNKDEANINDTSMEGAGELGDEGTIGDGGVPETTDTTNQEGGLADIENIINTGGDVTLEDVAGLMAPIDYQGEEVEMQETYQESQSEADQEEAVYQEVDNTPSQELLSDYEDILSGDYESSGEVTVAVGAYGQ